MLVYEYIFDKIDEKTCRFMYRFMNASQSPVPKKLNDALSRQLQEMAEKLADHCSKMEDSAFNPAFHRN
jgi:hypothetical protein